MITLNIAHLYPNELNLYGENGNVKALKYVLGKKHINANIININEDDELHFADYDLVYIGSGRQIFLDKAKERLEPYKEDILNYIKEDKVFIITGNAISIFEFLGLYEVIHLEKRLEADVYANSSLCNGPVRGFQNTNYLIKGLRYIIFTLDNLNGNDFTPFEGFKHHNLYVTSFAGPIMARNLNLAAYMIDKAKERKKPQYYL